MSVSIAIVVLIVAAAVSNTIVRCSETSINIESNEGENVTLNCTFNQSVTCYWKKNDLPTCIDDRYRFVHLSKNEEKYNQYDTVDCHARFRYNDCSIVLFNYKSKVDQGKYQCTEYNNSNSEIRTFNLTTKGSADESTNEQGNTNEESKYTLIYVNAAIGGLLVLVFVITALCVVKRRRKQKTQPEVMAVNVTKEEEVTLDTSGASGEPLVVEMRPPQPNPRHHTLLQRRSASTGCIHPYAVLHLTGSHDSTSGRTDEYYSNLYDDVMVAGSNLYDVVPPCSYSSTELRLREENTHALPPFTYKLPQKNPQNSEVVYAEVVMQNKTRCLNKLK